MKKLGAVVLATLVLGGLGYYIAILQMGDVDETLYSIDMDEVRALATSIDGPLPTKINAEAPIGIEFPGAAVITGWSWSPHKLPIYAYQVVYPDGHIMIDAAMNEAQAAAGGGASFFDEASYARLMSALSGARQIVFTHEHYDHIGGAIAHPDAIALLERVRMTDLQVANSKNGLGVEYPEGALDGYEALSYDGMLAIAPGVVLIEAAGHTPGSQIIYVRRADGQEYFFIGDVAWTYAGIDQVRTRPNLVSRGILGEDRARTHAQVAELKEIEQANPALAIIVGHDASRTGDQIANGLLGNQFE
jgi:glyoxylase-like metal-dependent hydrolase (beta-lactamase superfamily II)